MTFLEMGWAGTTALSSICLISYIWAMNILDWPGGRAHKVLYLVALTALVANLVYAIHVCPLIDWETV